MFACIILKDLLIPVGWIVAYLLGLSGAFRIERARMLRGVRGAIAIILDEAHDSNDLAATHSSSLETLKPHVFNALPLLRKGQQQSACNAWREYRKLNVTLYNPDNMSARIGKNLGEKITTQKEAIEIALAALDKALR